MFFKLLVALMVFSMVTPAHGSPAKPLLPFGVVDTHVHMATTTNGISYSWAHDPRTLDPPEQCPCRPPCACNMTIPEYQHASAAWEVSDVVFCEVSANSDDWLKESQWVQSLADGPFKDSKPRIGAIMAQPPPGFGTSPVSNYSAQLDELQAKVPLVRGVRTDLAEHTPDKLAALKELGRRNLVVDFLSDIVSGIPFQIIRDTPTVKYQIEHLGCGCGVAALYANQTMYKKWQAAIKQLATLPNIQALQVGGTMAGFKSKDKVDAATIKPFVQTVVREFGFKRLVFEANWFFCNFLPDGPDKGMDGYGTWATLLVPMLKELGATADDLEHLFRTNALRAYGIKGK